MHVQIFKSFIHIRQATPNEQLFIKPAEYGTIHELFIAKASTKTNEHSTKGT
jgi:hypothetical protein